MSALPTNQAIIASALDILHGRKGNLFLTGRAGTGKTTFLERARTELEATGRKLIVVAPTGIAAVNARGATIHSVFNVPPKAFHPDGPEFGIDFGKTFRYTAEKLALFREVELLFVDEVSMVRADLLDVVDIVLRRVRNSTLPFGGVQVCLIGDAFQLAPVVTDEEERALLQAAYVDNYHFYGARAFARSNYQALELPEVMRQRDGGAFV